MFVTAPKSLPYPAVQIEGGATVAAGETVEVGAEVGASLLEQGWVKAAEAKAPTIPEVLAAVGDDPHAAAEAHTAEEARDKPRPSLLSKLAAVIAANPNPSPDGDNHKES